MSNVLYLHGSPPPIARFLRVSEHRRLDQLLAANKLPYSRLIIEAGSFNEQSTFIESLRHRGEQLTLDTNVAELSAISRFSGKPRNAPWSVDGTPLVEAHLKGSAGAELMRKVARFAVVNGFSRVLAANHFLPDITSPWTAIDLENCVALRRALDIEGGREIAIDFPLMVSSSSFNDGSQRTNFVRWIASLPFDSLWLRVSNFGSDATAAGSRKYIVAAKDFHQLGKPIVADGVGGMSGTAIVAFGAASGLCFGVASKERFDASSWYKPPKPNGGGGGGGHSLFLPGVDFLLKKEDAAAIIDAPGGRRICSCGDRECCPCGFEDTLKDPKRHFLRQRALSCEAIAAVPEVRRARHYLDKDLRDADQKARALAKLKVSNEKLSLKLNKNMLRFDRLRDVLGSLEVMSEAATRSQAFTDRSSPKSGKIDRFP